VLGPTCQRLVECLSNAEPQTDREWFETADVPRRSFCRAKPRLLAEGLVVRDAGGVYRSADDLQERLDRIAEESGAVERHRRKVQRYALDRRGYHGFRLWATGLDARFQYWDGQFVDLKTGQPVSAADVFSVSNRERAKPPEIRDFNSYRDATWRCPIAPEKRWQPSAGEIRVSVRQSRAVAA
jgi:hypothetical protein